MIISFVFQSNPINAKFDLVVHKRFRRNHCVR
jgi:hypothetical protein